MAGYVTISRLKLELPIYLGATKKNLEKGAVHLSQTSIPIGGENTIWLLLLIMVGMEKSYFVI